jgi:hypothetical protein
MDLLKKERLHNAYGKHTQTGKTWLYTGTKAGRGSVITQCTCGLWYYKDMPSELEWQPLVGLVAACHIEEHPELYPALYIYYRDHQGMVTADDSDGVSWTIRPWEEIEACMDRPVLLECQRIHRALRYPSTVEAHYDHP